MILVAHRINDIKGLRNVPKSLGVEVDIRDFKGRLILQHEPFKDGVEFAEFLHHYDHRFVILNVKTEGIESEVLKLVQGHKIEDYFFLDLTFPSIVKLIRRGVSKIAVRFSEFEPIESCLALKGRVDWVWVDCFNDIPLTAQTYRKLKEHFRLCLVSPELQGHPVERVLEFKERLRKMPIDAVCSDRTDLWDKHV
ncbi:MAG: hypothetical protein QMD05_09610 [Candidatus Brocadiaceae bacterium]|nr:hypothetical protein [Candidatus Brocadiaceae bacterium]